jgi:small subunit ribosomal protein S4
LVSSRAEARQLIGHRHFVVNGRPVNIPSFQLLPGMIIEVRERSRAHDVFQQSGSIRRPPVWMSVDSPGKRIQVLHVPAREEMELPEMREQFIVEFYSR